MELTFKENTLLICPDSLKRQVLKYNYEHKIISDIKFETLDSYKKNYFFDYGIKEIKYLMDQYAISVSNAKEILNNLYYVDTDKVYGNEKLDNLVQYKKELEEHNLLVKNPIFKKVLANKNVVVAGYGKLSSFDKAMITGKTVEIKEEDFTNKEFSYYSFTSIEEEVEYLYNSIFDLLESGVDIQKIFVVNATDVYHPYFNRFNSVYPFSIEVADKDYLIGVELAKTFYQMVLAGKTREEIYDFLNEKELDVNKQLINILNKYCEYDLKTVAPLILDDLQSTTLPKANLTNVVKRANVNDVFTKDEYVFMVGFNDKTPAMKSDTAYITNNIRNLVGLDTTEKDNILTKENFLNSISHIENLMISYCENTPFEKFNPSTLIDSSWIKKSYQSSYRYSEGLNKTKYAYLLDELYKFNQDHSDLGMLYHNYGEDEFQTYDNHFDGLNSQQVSEIKNQNLSYSSMNIYYECSYRYYLEKILGISKFENSFLAKLGTLCHDTLELYCTNPNGFDFDSAWKDCIDSQNQRLKENKLDDAVYLNEMEHFFVDKVKEEIRKDIEIIKKQKDAGILELVKCENKFEFKVTDKVKFKGYIDKVMYHHGNDGNDLVAIIDYKTGNSVKIEKDLFQYGLSLQLPSYLYLMKHSSDFDPDHIQFGGFYLQHILNTDLNYNKDKSREAIKTDSMRLEGYSNSDVDVLELIDSKVADGASETIRNIRIKKDRTPYSNCKVLSDEEMNGLVDIVDEKVHDAADAIMSAKYSINPKIINGENRSCGYCPYLAICYRRDKDKQYIFTKEQED